MNRFELGVCEWSLKARGKTLFDMVSRAGLSCIQVGVGTETFLGQGMADPAMVDEYREAAALSGISIVSPCPQFVDEYSFTRPSGNEEAEIAAALVERAIALIPVFGCDHFLLPVLGKNTICDGPSFHRAVAYIRAFAEKAAEYHAKTYLEVNLSIAQVEDLLDAVDRDDVKIFFDSQNLYGMNGTCMARYFTELAQRDLVGGVHVKDGTGSLLSGSLLGEGTSGFEKTARAIRESNYRGCILAESVYANPAVAQLGSEEELLAKDAETMRRVFA